MTFEEWWSQALSMHDIPIDPNDANHFYDYKAAFEAGIEVPGEGESWPPAFMHDLNSDRFVKGDDLDPPNYNIDYWDTKYDQPAEAIDMIRNTYRREEVLDQKGLFDVGTEIANIDNQGESDNVQV